MGLLDKPAEQWQGALELDLPASSGGHVAVMGAPQSGKSGAAACRSSPPPRAHPHAGRRRVLLRRPGGLAPDTRSTGCRTSAAWRRGSTPDRVRRTVAEVPRTSSLEREQLFAAQRPLDSAAPRCRRVHRAGPPCPGLDVAVYIFLVVDGWSVFKEEFEEPLTDIVQEIANRGLGYGVHLVIRHRSGGPICACPCRR